MEFRILGPLEVVNEGERVPLEAPKPRGLLGVLLLHPNEIVSSARLIDELWGERPPPTASKIVQTYVSQLRRALGPDLIVTRPPGYMLQIEEGALDAARFHRLTSEGRREAAGGNHARAERLFQEALALWRGAPFADVVFESSARNEADALEEERMGAVVDRFDCELALGRHDEVVADLETLVRLHPLRERLLAQLMLALYRSGRQTEALGVYRESRERLRDDFGIEPSPALKLLERRILLQDPALDPRAPGEPTGAQRPVSSAPQATEERPAIRYAKSGDVNVAYTVVGEGLHDLVCIPGFVSNVDLIWDEASWGATFYRRLASFCRVILFDKRGTGLSDRVAGVPSLEVRMDDARAVMDAAGVARAPILGMSEGAPMALLFAATYPERASALILYGSSGPVAFWTPETPWLEPREQQLQGVEGWDEREWGTLEHARSSMEHFAPSLATENEVVRSWATMQRRSASPGAVKALSRMNMDIDIRAALPTVRVPTLIVHRIDEAIDVRNSRYLAERIAGARLVELPGRDHSPAVNSEQIVKPIRQFLDELWSDDLSTSGEPDRALATVLITDIPTSNRPALERARSQLRRFAGRELDPKDPTFGASFDGPARAIRCGLAISESGLELGIEPRVGLHTGECDRVDERISGLPIGISAAISGRACPGEVLVSGTVRDLVAGSGIAFEQRESLRIEAIDDECRLFAVKRPRGNGRADIPPRPEATPARRRVEPL